MKFEKNTIQKCCGGFSTYLKLESPIDNNLLSSFVKLGFTELTHFTVAGLLYVENYDFIITGSIGSNRLQIKCRRANCEQKMMDFLIILRTL
jgi:hypothetical protein